MKIKFVKLNPLAQTPTQSHTGDAGFDLTAVSKKWNDTYCVWEYGTGIAMELPDYLWGDLRPRSSIYKTGLVMSNSSGVIDSGYRGEIMAKFYAIHSQTAHIRHYEIGDRICQLILTVKPKIMHMTALELPFTEVSELTNTDRGAHGYGSTGK